MPFFGGCSSDRIPRLDALALFSWVKLLKLLAARED
jgi:hypothetical protein